MTILVTGATGKVGSTTVRGLLDRGVPVRAFVRDAVKARPLAEAGAQIAVGDLEDPATIDAVLHDVTGIVLVSPAIPDQELNVVRAAIRAGVGHIVKASSKASPDSPILRRRGQAQIEAGLADSGIPHTILRSNAYMQNTFALAPAIAATDGFGSSTGEGRIGMVDTRDVGAVAAAIAADPDTHAGATYVLTGPEAITYTDIAGVLSELLERTIVYRPTTFDQDRENMIAAGVPEPIATMNAQAFALTAEGDADWVTDDVATILGRPATSFERFARDHVAVFRSEPSQ